MRSLVAKHPHPLALVDKTRIMQHAILVVSLAMTWPLNVLILTAILSSTIKDGNALSRYGSWIAVVGFFLIFGL